MNRKQDLQRRTLSIWFMGILIGGTWLWCFSQPEIHVTVFLQIPFGVGEDHLSEKSPFNMYHQSRPITTTGTVAFNERLNACIIDFRILGMMDKISNRILYFDSQGQKTRVVMIGGDKSSLAGEISLGSDGTVWIAMNFYSQQPSYYSSCVRKYDRTGRGVLQFGEPRPDDKWAKPVSPQVKRALTKRYHHLWGAAYRFGSARIQGLWADRKGRVYVLTEYPSLHVFADNGKPLAAFDFIPNDKITFEGDLGDLGGGPLFVDFDGRIYTYDVQNKWVEVWMWEPRVQKVRTATVPESGCVVGVDTEENIYYMSFFRDRIYRISPDGKAQKIFEPRHFYQNEMIREWDKIFASTPRLRERLEKSREEAVAMMKQSIPVPQEAIDRYQRDLYEYAMSRGNGPRTGHIAHVDKEGNLYLTLVGADYFRIDKISLRGR